MKFSILVFTALLSGSLCADELYSFDRFYQNRPGRIFDEIKDIEHQSTSDGYTEGIEHLVSSKSQRLKVIYKNKNIFLNGKKVRLTNISKEIIPLIDGDLIRIYQPQHIYRNSKFLCIDTWALHANSTAQRRKLIFFFPNKKAPLAFVIPGYLSSCTAIKFSENKEIEFPIVKIENEKSNEQSLSIYYKKLVVTSTKEITERYTGTFPDIENVYQFLLK
ncbi:hypothetical protein [Azospira oryzae]|uniref:hypothetical protein n=1 Tax=Azospira oryzae TaxID=146939 RepID=UPI0019654494|nr:hypothetical protein [Azospira oryzae]